MVVMVLRRFAVFAFLSLTGPVVAAPAPADLLQRADQKLRYEDLVWGLGLAAALLWLGLSARLSDFAAERTRSRTYQVMIYVAGYVTFITAATFPLTLYEGFFREHAYGLSDQSFLSWLGDYAVIFAVSLAAALIVLPIIYFAIRVTRERWWIWGAAITILFSILGTTIYPVFIAPLLNHYTPLAESPLKKEILSLAAANGVPADNVYTFNASRQTNRISANVSGFLGTTRISLNDNLLKQGTHDEIMAVLGHEIGHYVMGHVVRGILLMGLVIIAAFAFMNWGFYFATGVFGGNWQVRRVDDIAGLPLLMALMSLFLYFATPVTNSITRVMERQADIFGVNAVRKPDAFATVTLKLSTYRKLEPGKLEETIFFDHPSGKSRIHDMMVWKREHIGDVDMRGTEDVP